MSLFGAFWLGGMFAYALHSGGQWVYFRRAFGVAVLFGWRRVGAWLAVTVAIVALALVLWPFAIVLELHAGESVDGEDDGE